MNVHRLIAGVAVTAICLSGCGGGGESGAKSPPPVTYTVSGRVQKGPFAIGSSVAVNEQDRNLSPTGKVYNVLTSDALGDFSVSSAIGTLQVEIVAQGFYIDELTGQLSPSQITLRAIVDLSVNPSPTVNVLTTLQEQRLKTLVSQGQTFAAAYAQSENEVLAIFEINAAKVNSLSPLSSMRIDGGNDSDSVLLATSVLLSQMASDAAKANGTTQAAEMSNLVNTLAAQLASSGTVTATYFVSARNLAESEISVATITTNLQTYYTRNGVSVVTPKFQDWLDPSNSGVLPQRLIPVSSLAFTDITGAIPGHLVTSISITVSGLGTGVAVPVSVSAGTTLLKNGTAVAGSLATATDGDVLGLRVTAAGYLGTTQSTISAGSSSTAWRVMSEPLGGTISGLTGTGLVLQENGGNNLAVALGSTTFSFQNAIALGTNYRVTVLADPTAPPLQVCSVLNGTGTVGTTVSNMSVVCRAPSEQLILWDPQGIASAALLIDPTTGALDPSGTTIPATPARVAIVTDPAGKLVFIADWTGLNIAAYSVNPSTGALASVKGSPFSTGADHPNDLVVEPTGRFLYVGYGGAVGAFAIDGTTGALTAAGSPFYPPGGLPPTTPLGCPGECIATHTMLYYLVANGPGVYTIFGLAIDATTGAITWVGQVAPYVSFRGAWSAAVDPAGKFLYLGNGPEVFTYTIDAQTGVLTESGSTPSPTIVDLWVGITLAPTGRFAYLIGQGMSGRYLSAFSVDASAGTLTPLSSGTVATDPRALGILFDRTGKFVYVPNVGSISGYAFDATTGALTPIDGSPFPTPVTGQALIVRLQ
jgi:hypothetical protein